MAKLFIQVKLHRHLSRRLRKVPHLGICCGPLLHKTKNPPPKEEHLHLAPESQLHTLCPSGWSYSHLRTSLLKDP